VQCCFAVIFHVCAACIALVDEMSFKIGTVSDKSTVQVGSFRIDSNGNQQLREVRSFLLHRVSLLSVTAV